MQRYTKSEVSEHLLGAGVLPMFSHPDEKISIRILEALYKAGVRIVEFTNRPDEALAIFKCMRQFADDHLPGLVLGAGTIMNEAQAESFAHAGAAFLVAPSMDREVGMFCRNNDLFWCPGASTLNEILQAEAAGADLVKLFPAAQLGGPAYLKAIRAPCPWLQLIPTGGISTDSKVLRNWIEAGAEVIGMGSHLFEGLDTGLDAMDRLTARASELLGLLQNLKTQKKLIS
jgi:2-dehydro-3-deoxyphosphogluconate aldolase/(4S)-4-hydroxy-2-oxoglutarate aldolase